MSNLSSFIEKDIKSHIEDGQKLPSALSLPELSKHYGVSITPVRNALQALEEQGYLVRLPNRRLRINPSKFGSGRTEDKIYQPKEPSDWADILLQEVMIASLSPKAVFLRELTLADKYNVGRSIIRDTFSRFSGAALLDHVPRKGWLVHPLNENDLVAYLTVRESLELLALDLARPHIDAGDLQEILENASDAHDFTLHRYLIEKSGNRYVRDFFRQDVARYYTQLFHFAAPEASAVEEMTSQHEAILKALLAKDWERARSKLSHHIRIQRNVLAKLLLTADDDNDPV